MNTEAFISRGGFFSSSSFVRDPFKKNADKILWRIIIREFSTIVLFHIVEPILLSGRFFLYPTQKIYRREIEMIQLYSPDFGSSGIIYFTANSFSKVFPSFVGLIFEKLG